MQWNDHSRLVGQHAFLGASKYHWLNYDTQRLVDAFMSCQAKEKGTRLHAFAAECINLKQKLPKSKKTLNAYVNDAIGFRMDPEQVLFYSENCFGTADAIAFNDKDNFLRIHDLKTGAVPAHMEQLFIYDALFCMLKRITQKLERMVRMMAMLWAQEIMSAETMEEAKALYKRCPRLLKEKVKAILIKSGFEEITQE